MDAKKSESGKSAVEKKEEADMSQLEVPEFGAMSSLVDAMFADPKSTASVILSETMAEKKRDGKSEVEKEDEKFEVPSSAKMMSMMNAMFADPSSEFNSLVKELLAEDANKSGDESEEEEPLSNDDLYHQFSGLYPCEIAKLCEDAEKERLAKVCIPPLTVPELSSLPDSVVKGDAVPSELSGEEAKEEEEMKRKREVFKEFNKLVSGISKEEFREIAESTAPGESGEESEDEEPSNYDDFFYEMTGYLPSEVDKMKEEAEKKKLVKANAVPTKKSDEEAKKMREMHMEFSKLIGGISADTLQELVESTAPGAEDQTEAMQDRKAGAGKK